MTSPGQVDQTSLGDGGAAAGSGVGEEESGAARAATRGDVDAVTRDVADMDSVTDIVPASAEAPAPSVVEERGGGGEGVEGERQSERDSGAEGGVVGTGGGGGAGDGGLSADSGSTDAPDPPGAVEAAGGDAGDEGGAEGGGNEEPAFAEMQSIA